MKQGLIQLIVIIILAVIILSLLGVNIAGIINNKTLKENFEYIWGWTKYVWAEYLQAPAGVIWKALKENILVPAYDAFRDLKKNNPPPDIS